MPTSLGSVRRLLLTPQLAEVSFAKRGFPASPSAATQRLEAIPQAVICGYHGVHRSRCDGTWAPYA